MRRIAGICLLPSFLLMFDIIVYQPGMYLLIVYCKSLIKLAMSQNKIDWNFDAIVFKIIVLKVKT